MPPTLVLLLGVAFVYAAFRSERSHTAPFSKALIWPTLWYLVGATRPFGVWMIMWGVPLPGGGSDDPTEGSAIDRYFFLTLIIIGIRVLSRRHFKWGIVLRNNPWLTAFFMFMAASILWSQYPYVSFKRFIKVIGSVVMAMVVLTDERPFEAMLVIMRRCLYIHLPMSLICIRYFRNIAVSFDWSGDASWQGISTSKNTLGQMAMIGVLCFSWEIYRDWHRRGWFNLNTAYLLMALYLLKGSEGAVSMTSLSVSFFALAVFLRIQSLRSRLTSVRTFVQTVFFGTISFIALIIFHSIAQFKSDSTFGQLITMFGRDITLTGRTEIWHDMYAAAAANPLFGVGYGGFWIGRMANIPWNAGMTWVLAQGHSGYVDTYLQIGLIGSFLLAGVLFTTIRRLLASLTEDFDFACFRITMFLTILFVNITESTYLRGEHHLWFIMQLVIWMVPSASTSRYYQYEEQEPVVYRPETTVSGKFRVTNIDIEPLDPQRV